MVFQKVSFFILAIFLNTFLFQQFVQSVETKDNRKEKTERNHSSLPYDFELLHDKQNYRKQFDYEKNSYKNDLQTNYRILPMMSQSLFSNRFDSENEHQALNINNFFLRKRQVSMRIVAKEISGNEEKEVVVNLTRYRRDALTDFLLKKGFFDDSWSAWKQLSFKGVFNLLWTRSNSSVPSSDKLDAILPVLEPVVVSESPENAIRATWIGHSTVLVQFENVTILTDPIFSQRASPTQWFGPKRYRLPALTVDQLPNFLDAVLISHSHYDHLDLNSVKELDKRYGERITWFVGLGLKVWFSDLKIANVVELDWWEENRLPAAEHIRIVFLPAEHHSRRTWSDNNKMLWGSWAVIGKHFRCYTAGDTGYDDENFKQIGTLFGPFNLAAIPIGAYEPRNVLRSQHINPEEAVKIHQEIRSKFSIAIHWGTFDLSTEYFLEPPVRLRESLKKQSVPANSFVTFQHGESRLIYANGTTTQEPTKKLAQ